MFGSVFFFSSRTVRILTPWGLRVGERDFRVVCSTPRLGKPVCGHRVALLNVLYRSGAARFKTAGAIGLLHLK